MSEATALPTQPQPLPFVVNIFIDHDDTVLLFTYLSATKGLVLKLQNMAF